MDAEDLAQATSAKARALRTGTTGHLRRTRAGQIVEHVGRHRTAVCTGDTEKRQHHRDQTAYCSLKPHLVSVAKPRKHGNLESRKGLVEILLKVFDGLETHRNADQTIPHTPGLAHLLGHGRMTHQRGLTDQGLDTAEAFSHRKH